MADFENCVLSDNFGCRSIDWVSILRRLGTLGRLVICRGGGDGEPVSMLFIVQEREGESTTGGVGERVGEGKSAAMGTGGRGDWGVSCSIWGNCLERDAARVSSCERPPPLLCLNCRCSSGVSESPDINRFWVDGSARAEDKPPQRYSTVPRGTI